MDLNDIVNEIKRKKSYLCIGLDSDIEKIPKHLLDLFLEALSKSFNNGIGLLFRALVL